MRFSYSALKKSQKEVSVLLWFVWLFGYFFLSSHLVSQSNLWAIDLSLSLSLSICFSIIPYFDMMTLVCNFVVSVYLCKINVHLDGSNIITIVFICTHCYMFACLNTLGPVFHGSWNCQMNCPFFPPCYFNQFFIFILTFITF